MISLKFYNKSEWEQYSKHFHALVFNNSDFSELENIDFACVVFDKDEPIGFATMRVLDKLHVYMQYGGSLTKNNYTNLKGYLELIEALKSQFENITTLIENKNQTMIKFAMKAGFEIIGVRYKKNCLYLEHSIEVKHG